jgi:hypothetical protein
MKELIDRNKNYMWMKPEDLVKDQKEQTVEDLLKVPNFGPDGLDKKKLSPMELYYESLATKAAAPKPGPSPQKDDAVDFFGGTSRRGDPLGMADLEVPTGLKDSAQNLKKLFVDDDEKMPTGTATRSTFNNVFGVDDPLAARAKDQKEMERKRWMDEYRSVLDSSWKPATTAGSLQPLDGADSAQPKVDIVTVGASSLSRRDAPDSLLKPLTPVTAPLPPQDVNLQALGQFSSPPSLLKSTDAPKTGPARPSFEFPKRSGL